jgi:hypothetical protein
MQPNGEGLAPSLPVYIFVRPWCDFCQIAHLFVFFGLPLPVLNISHKFGVAVTPASLEPAEASSIAGQPGNGHVRRPNRG